MSTKLVSHINVIYICSIRKKDRTGQAKGIHMRGVNSKAPTGWDLGLLYISDLHIMVT